MAETLDIGSPVWAKMKGFPPWPGLIVDPPELLKKQNKKNSHCIFFFGSNNYSWIDTSSVKPYQEEDLSKAKVSLKEAVKSINEYISNGCKGDYDPNMSETKGSAKKTESPQKKVSTPIKEPKQKETPKQKATRTPKSQEKPKADKVTAKRKSSVKATPETPTVKKGRNRNSSYSSESEITPSSRSPFLFTNSTPYNRPGVSLLARPSNISRPESQPFSLGVTQTLKNKKITPSTLKFGFIGLGIMGRGIVKNLLNSDHRVVVWNRSPDRCKEFETIGAEVAETPEDTVSMADITFSCVSNPTVVNEIVLGNCGVINAISPGKGYVELSSVDPMTSTKIASSVKDKGGRYLEAQLQGSKEEAEEGTVIIIAAGDRTLYDDCQSCFEAFGRSSFYLGDVGSACKMNLVIQLMTGITLAGLAEGMALADRASLQQADVLEVIGMSPLNSTYLLEKGKAIIDREFGTSCPLQHLQKDLQLALTLGDTLQQPLPLTASANEIFKHAKRLGYGDHDSSAVYIRARF